MSAINPDDPSIAHVNRAIDSFLQQGNMGNMLLRVSAAIPEGKDFTDYYTLCDDVMCRSEDELDAAGQALHQRLSQELGGDETAAQMMMSLYGVNLCLKSYIDAATDAAIEGSFQSRRNLFDAKNSIKEIFTTLSGLGEHQSTQFLRQFFTAVDDMVQAVVGNSLGRS